MTAWIGSLLSALLLGLGTATTGSPAADAPADTTADTTAGTTAGTATDAPARTAASRITLGGVRVALPSGSRQVVTVNHTRGVRARVALWQQVAGQWELVARSKLGRTGYGGLVRARLREQGTGTTPLGTFRLLSSFGTHDLAAGQDLSHRRIRAGDYWVQDNRSDHYNRYRNKSEGGFRWWLPSGHENGSELLTDFAVEYEYSVVTSFNYRAQVRHRGAGIFLHVNGTGPTAGCVSAPRWFLLRTMATLDPDLRPVIAIGR